MRKFADLCLQAAGRNSHLTDDNSCRLGDFTLESNVIARRVCLRVDLPSPVLRHACCMSFLLFSPSRDLPKTMYVATVAVPLYAYYVEDILYL
jgi:hypothetical protein